MAISMPLKWVDKREPMERPRGEIAMFTIFDPSHQTDPGNTAATTLINNRPLLLTVPTVQQIAATNPDAAGPNLAVRFGIDNNPGEQNLVPLGYSYGTEGRRGKSKMPINPVSQFAPEWQSNRSSLRLS